MDDHIRFRGKRKPPATGFATPHVASRAKDTDKKKSTDRLDRVAKSAARKGIDRQHQEGATIFTK